MSFAANRWKHWRQAEQAEAMRVARWFLTLPLLAASSFAQTVQEKVVPQLIQAQALNELEQPRAAIEILEPLVRKDSHELNGVNRGIAWNYLGSSYEDLEQYDKARRCYEEAIRILRPIPAAQAQYASAVDNLGSIEAWSGHFDESKSLRFKALKVYRTLESHDGIAIVSNNLAVVALLQHDLKAARRNVEEALREEQLTDRLSASSRASIYIAKGAVEKAQKDFHQAVAAYQQAIDVLTKSYGSDYHMVGVAYTLLGQAVDALGDHRQALADLKHALALFEKAPGRGTKSYLEVELAYAQVLRGTGSLKEASILENQAKAGLANFRVQQCGGCTISAESLR
jgi:tetratricopeptide (TPR) repeat protein